MQDKFRFYTLNEKESLDKLKTDKEGLSSKEAKKRLKEYGQNELIKLRKLNTLKLFFNQFLSLLVLILIVASVISALLGHWVDFYVIMGIVVVNAFFGFFQEYKAEKAIEKLKSMLVPSTKVFRNEKVMEIDSKEIVPGDILVLNEGDKIMADSRIISASSLRVNEAPFTGESVPVDKLIGALKEDIPITSRTNMIYQGTDIVRGNCHAVVVATGMNTEYGKIAELVQEVQPEKNPLRVKLDKFAKNLSIITLILMAIIVVVGITFGFDKFEMFLIAVSLAVSVIPEGLPAVITITLALSTQNMLKINCLIRKLPAAETLGRATVICSDKTGTMTKEKMQVRNTFFNNKFSEKIDKSSSKLLFKVGALCNNARIEKDKGKEYLIGDPTEQALLLSAREAGFNIKKEDEENHRIKEFPFSSERKMMSVVRHKNAYVSYCKGAPEVIISKCSSEVSNGKVVDLNGKRKKELVKKYEEMASNGLRVLGFAYKAVVGEITQKKAENSLIFVGLQGLIDPPRKEVKEAIKSCNDAGIKVVMITGDSVLTAKAVGNQVGLSGGALTSQDLEKMSDETLCEKLDSISIFARVNPEDKLRIVEMFKKKDEIVSVTGDGINDAPALKKADIGISVNRGTDVAKDASEMVLLDNNFASIPKAVKEGRKIYDNIKKFIKYLLAANFAQVALVLVTLLFGLPLPMLPLQILWINLVTDSFPALALSKEAPERDLMKRKPKRENLLKGIIPFIVISGLLSFSISFLVFYLYLDDLYKARTMAVTSAVIFEMFLAFNSKSKGSVFKSPMNKYLIYAVSFSIFLHIIAIYTVFGSLFSFVPLGLNDWILVFSLCLTSFGIIEVVKKLSLKKI